MNQAIFLFIAKEIAGIPILYSEIAFIGGFALALDHTLQWLRTRQRPTSVNLSGLSSSMNLVFMLGATNIVAFVFAIALGLAQKHVLRFRGRHFQNPSNFGIWAALLLFPNETFTQFGYWGHNWQIGVLTYVLAWAILRRLALTPTTIAFLITYFTLSLVYVTPNAWALTSRMLGAGFAMFACFMITDPAILPRTRTSRILHGCLTAALYVGLLLYWGEKPVNMFLTLVLSGCALPLWRVAEQSQAPRGLQYATMAFAALLTLAALAAYPSQYNRRRALAQSTAPHYTAPVDLGINWSRSKDIRVSLFVEAKKWASQVQQDPHGTSTATAPFARLVPDRSDKNWNLYRPNWKEAHVLELPYNTPLSNSGTSLLPYRVHVTEAELGPEFAAYAAIAGGDINQDGLMDIVLAHPTSALGIYLQERNGWHDATHELLGENIPSFIEYVALADFDNDTYLDLLVFYSQYKISKPPDLLQFDPESRHFRSLVSVLPDIRPRSVGGVALGDVNADGLLDMYISVGQDWYSLVPRLEAIPSALARRQKDVFLLSKKGQLEWEYAPERIDKQARHAAFSGMSAIFADINRDARLDLLVGNDFFDPSLTFWGEPDGRLRLVLPHQIPANTEASMSYFPLDADNDGVPELWENGTGFKPKYVRELFVSQAPLRNADGSGKSAQLNLYLRKKAYNQFHCAEYFDPQVHAYCVFGYLTAMALERNSGTYCRQIKSQGLYWDCLRGLYGLRTESASYASETEINHANYPKQVPENVMMSWDQSRERFQRVLLNDTAAYTDFAWNAASADFNLDGYVDIYVGTSMTSFSQTPNYLLINDPSTTRPGRHHFFDDAPRFGVDYADDVRGILAEDIDRDGDIDLAMNAFLTAPILYISNVGSHPVRAISLELRNNAGNYYGIGAVVTLVLTNGQIQTRWIANGGHWNASQPAVAHFGVSTHHVIDHIRIVWPDGESSVYDGFRTGYHYVIYR